MSMKFAKIWGETEPLLVTPLIEIHRIYVDPFTKCSEHYHARKWNAFYLISGRLNIHVEKKDYDLIDVTKLEPGDLTTVKPGEYHWFESEDDWAEALEIYYLEGLGDDIVRRTVGSLVSDDEFVELMGA